MAGERHIARGSWVCIDEEYVCSIQPDGSKEWNRGDRSLTAPQFVERVKKLYMRNGLTDFVIPPRRVIMDSAVTAQLGFGGHSDPVTLSTEFKKYGWQVTGSPKSSRAVGWQLMKSLLGKQAVRSLVCISQSDARAYWRRCLIASVMIATLRIWRRLRLITVLMLSGMY